MTRRLHNRKETSYLYFLLSGQSEVLRTAPEMRELTLILGFVKLRDTADSAPTVTFAPSRYHHMKIRVPERQ